MGAFGDIRQLKKQGKEAQKASGRRGGFRGMKDAIAESSEMLENAQAQAALLQTGLVARAEVRSATDTGRLINYQPEATFELDVTIEGRSPFRVAQTEVVPQTMLGMVQSGESLVVRVDPADQSKLAIDWAATQAGRAS